MLPSTKTLILVSLPWVGKDLIPHVPFISIIVVGALIVRDTVFAVSDTVAGTFGMGRLHFVHFSRETTVAFSIFAPNVCDVCFSTQNWFQTVAGIYGDAQRKCGHSDAIFQQKQSENLEESFLCGKPLSKCVGKRQLQFLPFRNAAKL